MNPISVSDIQRLLVRREANPIRTTEAISNYSNISRHRIEAIDLRAKLWFRSEALLKPVDWVCEPDTTVCVQDDIVERVELATVEIVEKSAGGIWGRWVHVN